MAARRRVAAAAPRSGVPSRAVSSPRVIPSIDQLMKRDAMRTLEAQYGADAARAAALREVEEETGVAADIHGLLDINDVILKDEAGTLRAHYLIAVFFGHWLSGEPAAGGDAAQARFVPFDSLGTLRMTDGLPEYIDRAWARLGTPEARAKP